MSSGSDSGSDDSDKSNADSEMSCLSRNSIKEETIQVAESDDSSAGEDDFNPFGNSGSEDEGKFFQACIL